MIPRWFFALCLVAISAVAVWVDSGFRPDPEETLPPLVCANPGVAVFDRVANSWRQCWVLHDGTVVSSRAY